MLSEKPSEQPRAKVEQQTKRPQRRHIGGIYANYPNTLPLNGQIFFTACTRSCRGIGEGIDVSDSADHTSVSTPADTRGPGNDPVSMGIPNIDERTWAAESTTANGEQARTKPGVEQGITMGKGSELTKETRNNASIVVGSAGMKSDKSPIAVILLVSFSLYLV